MKTKHKELSQGVRRKYSKLKSVINLMQLIQALVDFQLFPTVENHDFMYKVQIFSITCHEHLKAFTSECV